jgi:hypothetical protein
MSWKPRRSWAGEDLVYVPRYTEEKGVFSAGFLSDKQPKNGGLTPIF